MRELAISRLILAIMCGSYILSAALLNWAKIAGKTVPGWQIGAWVITGVIGALLLPWLSANRPLVSLAMLIVLGPWMMFALTEDARLRHYIIAVVDLAGLVAIGYSLWLIRRA